MCGGEQQLVTSGGGRTGPHPKYSQRTDEYCFHAVNGWGGVPARHPIQNKLHGLGNEPHVLGNGPLVSGNWPHVCIQFMNGIILIMGRLGWAICLSWPDWVR